ncbi:MAG TPA: biotin/lipoyl-binding protein [Anaerolineae bacterium]|nr:biotin/lipoyl-binding protein [Anaerolineae bacterium]
MRYLATVEGQTYEIEINGENEITVDGKPIDVDFIAVADHSVFSLILDGISYEAYVYPNETEVEVLMRGKRYPVHVEDERQIRLRQTSKDSVADTGEFLLKAPMPGLVVSVPVVMEQEVKSGDNLVILESMKMQNELKAPRDGRVTRLRVQAGDNVDQNQVLIVLE